MQAATHGVRVALVLRLNDRRSIAMRVPHDSYVLVADGAKMLFFRNEGDTEALNLQVVEAEQQRDEYDRDIKTDTAGQKPGIPGGPGGSTAGEADFHQQAEDRFAADAAERINRAAQSGSIKDLVVIASPKTLGELRKHYGKNVQEMIRAEIAKDLTGHPVDRIEAAIQAYEV
jgi:protein required for attachment to host cells